MVSLIGFLGYKKVTNRYKVMGLTNALWRFSDRHRMRYHPPLPVAKNI